MVTVSPGRICATGGLSPGPEHGDVVDDRQQADPRPGRRAGAHVQIGAAHVDGAAAPDSRTAVGTGTGSGEPRHAVSTPPRAWPGCPPAAARRRGLLGRGDGRHDVEVLPDAVAPQRRGRLVTQIAGLGPEVLEVGRVRRDQATVENRERVHPHGAVAEPGARRKPHAGHLGEGVPLLRVEALEHVAAPTGLDGIDDLVEPVAQNPLGVHADREHVRDRHR